MAIVRVQGTGVRRVSNETAPTKAFGSNVTAGNHIIVLVEGWSNPAWQAGDVTDSLGNTYQLAIAKNDFNVNDCAIYYAENITGGACTLTVNPAAVAGWYGAYAAVEHSGLLTSGSLDKTQTNADSARPVSTGSTGTLTQANEVVAAVMTIAATQTTMTIDNAGFTEEFEELDFSGHNPGEGDSKIVAATTAVNVSWTISPTDAVWSACIATFKGVDAGGGGAGSIPRVMYHLRQQGIA